MSKISKNMIKEYFLRWLTFTISFISNLLGIPLSLISFQFNFLLAIILHTVLMPITHLLGYYEEGFVPERVKTPSYKYISLRQVVIEKIKYLDEHSNINLNAAQSGGEEKMDKDDFFKSPDFEAFIRETTERLEAKEIVIENLFHNFGMFVLFHIKDTYTKMSRVENKFPEKTVKQHKRNLGKEAVILLNHQPTWNHYASLIEKKFSIQGIHIEQWPSVLSLMGQIEFYKDIETILFKVYSWCPDEVEKVTKKEGIYK